MYERPEALSLRGRAGLVDERVALPDDAVAVKDEDVGLVEEIGRDGELGAEAVRLRIGRNRAGE